MGRQLGPGWERSRGQAPSGGRSHGPEDKTLYQITGLEAWASEWGTCAPGRQGCRKPRDKPVCLEYLVGGEVKSRVSFVSWEPGRSRGRPSRVPQASGQEELGTESGAGTRLCSKPEELRCK